MRSEHGEKNSVSHGFISLRFHRLHGSYEALKYGTRSDGLSDLTGGIVESIPVKSGPDSIRPNMLRTILETTCIITCIAIRGNSSQFKAHPEKLPNGIGVGVSYRMCSLDKVETLMGDAVQLVRLRDPLATDTFGTKSGFAGEWSAMSGAWERVSIQERDRLLGQLDFGEFWMSFMALTETFTNLECVHLDTDTAKDELSLAERPKRWSIKMFQGFWRRGVSAGGCRNHDSFHLNPQLQLFVADKEDVIVALNQHTAVEPKVIGFTMYKLNSSEYNQQKQYKYDQEFLT